MNLPHIIVKPKHGQCRLRDRRHRANVYMFHYTPDAIVVRADSEFETIDDLDRLREGEPAAGDLLGFGQGHGKPPGPVHFDEMAEIDTTYVAFNGTGASVTANPW